MDFFSGEPGEFIALLLFCREHKISWQRLEETVAAHLERPHSSPGVEKLRALLGNAPEDEPAGFDDAICAMAQRQLSHITRLMA